MDLLTQITYAKEEFKIILIQARTSTVCYTMGLVLEYFGSFGIDS